VKRFPATLRWTLYGLGTIALVVVAVLATVRWWFPLLGDYKATIEEYLTSEVGQPVIIQELHTEWDGIYPSFLARGLRIRSTDGAQSAMRVGELRMSVDPLPLLRGEVALRHISINGLTIGLLRGLDGRISVMDLVEKRRDDNNIAAILGWWFRQERVSFRGGTVVWHDEADPAGPLTISNIGIELLAEEGKHRFTGFAGLPSGLSSAFTVSGELDDIPIGTEWNGVVEIDLRQLNLDHLPQIAREHLPWRSSGRLDIRLSTNWSRGRPSGGIAELGLYDFSIPYRKDAEPLAAKRLSTALSWHYDGGNWRITLIQPELDVGSIVHVGQFEIDRIAQAYTFRAEALNLKEIVTAIKKLKVKLPWQYVLDGIKPQGMFQSGAVTVDGPLSDPNDWRFEGEFSGLAWTPYRHFPGLSAVDGKLQMDKTRGQVSIRGEDVELDFPQALRGPVRFDYSSGVVTWGLDKGFWNVEVRDLSLRNEDIEIASPQINARLPSEPGPSPYIDARARIPRVELAELHNYFPAKAMSPKGTTWLDRAFVGGRATEGELRLRGNLREFPFKDGNGEFHFTAQVDGGVLEFDPKWSRVDDIQARVQFDNEHMRIEASGGRIFESRILHAVATSDELFLKKKPRLLRIDGELAAPVAAVVHFLTKGPLIKRPETAPSLTGQGDGTLSLKVDLPLGALQDGTQVSGSFLTSNGSVAFDNGVAVTSLDGRIDFTESRVTGKSLTGRMFDGPVVLDVTTVKPARPPQFAIAIKGRDADITRLEPVLGTALMEFVEGRTGWNARVEVKDGNADLRVHSEANGIRSTLPAPLEKEASESWPVDARVQFSHAGQDISFNIADRLHGVMLNRRQKSEMEFDRGQFAMGLGKADVPPEPGLQVVVEQPALDADQWIEAWNRAKRRSESAPKRGGSQRNLAEEMRVFRVRTGALHYLNRDLGGVYIEGHSSDSRDWVASVSGANVNGAVRAQFAPDENSVQLVLERLYWPQSRETAGVPEEPASRPRDYPRLALDVEDFHYDVRRLGRMRLRASPVEDSWRIDTFEAEQPALSISAQGVWNVLETGPQTRIDMVVKSKDLGTGLKQLGFPDQVAGGSADLKGTLSWPGSPGQFRFSELDGTMDIEAKKGRFLNVEPGTGRLFGLLNVDALTRRLTLDFSDVFSKGLAFDRINGKARILRGDLFSDLIYIIGPSAIIEVRGRVGLAKEDYAMDLIIAPDLGGNLSLISALANPAAGAVVFVVQKLFKKQLARVVHYRYQVSGSWNDPKITRVREEPVRE